MHRFSGLKLNIAGTVILLLLASMILGNFVTVMFWKKNLVEMEINQALGLTRIISLIAGEKISNSERLSSEDLGKFVDGRSNILSVVLFDGKGMISFPESLVNHEIEQVVRSAGVLRQEVIRKYGSIWGLFSSQEVKLFIAEPLVGEKLKKHAFCVEVSLVSVYQAIKQDLKTVFVYLFVNAIILFVIGWYRFANMVVRPIERIAAASESYNITDGFSLDNDLATSEFGQLSMALNSMLLKIELDRDQLSKAVTLIEVANIELVETQKEMILAEKLASVGRLAAGLAHEIGNPLGIVQGYVELLEQSDVSEDNKRMYAGRAFKELDRINTLIRQLLDFARTSKAEREDTSIVPIFTELKDMLSIQKRDVVIEIVSLVENDHIKCDRDGLRQVFLNCLLNAMDAIEECSDSRSGLIIVTISAKSGSEDGRTMVIKLEDNGIGVREEESFEYFEPFYTTKEPGKGTGLGLSVSHTIIEAHDGSIKIEGKKGAGAVVTIEIPVATDRRVTNSE